MKENRPGMEFEANNQTSCYDKEEMDERVEANDSFNGLKIIHNTMNTNLLQEITNSKHSSIIKWGWYCRVQELQYELQKSWKLPGENFQIKPTTAVQLHKQEAYDWIRY